MLSSREQFALAHIRDNIEHALTFVVGQTIEEFIADIRNFYAVTRALEIISEASRRLSDTTKDRHADIPWKDIAGAGNIYRHVYEDVVRRQVWTTVHEALPSLLVAVNAELARPE